MQNFLQKILATTLASLFILFFVSNVFAEQSFTLIPTEIEIGENATNSEKIKVEKHNSLVESFRTGNFEIWQLGDYVQYLIEILIVLAGGISVLFIVIGGYQYMIGSITDDKEAGKKTIAYALGGFAVSVLAWTIVNFVQVWLTGG
jgi:hypothetical protein